MAHLDFESSDHMDTYIAFVKQLPGRIHLCTESDPSETEEKIIRKQEFYAALVETNRLTYVSGISTRTPCSYAKVMKHSANMIFSYMYYYDFCHVVNYLPSLFNGRHIVDVLRAVCAPADVSEAELERVKEAASEAAVPWAGEEWAGVC